MKPWLCGLVGLALGALLVGVRWQAAATRAARVADSVTAVIRLERDAHRALAASANRTLGTAIDTIGALRQRLADRPPVRLVVVTPPADSAVATLLAAIGERDSAIAGLNRQLADADRLLGEAAVTLARVGDKLQVSQDSLDTLERRLTVPAPECPKPLAPPRIPGLGLDLTLGATAGVTLAGKPFAGVGMTLGGKIPVRKLLTALF